MPDETRGTVVQLPSGAWRWRVSTGVRLLQPDGTYKRQRLSGTTTSERAAYRSVREALARSDGTDRGDPTVAEWAKVWLNDAAKRVTPATLRSYEGMSARWLVPCLGALKVDDVRPRHITEMMADMEAAGASKATRQQARNLASGLFRLAQEREVVDRSFANPARIARPPVGERARKTHTPTSAEVRRALDIALEHEGAAAHLMVRLALITGARRGSLAALRWTDLDDGRLFVGRSVTVLPGIHVEGSTKTGQTVHVPLDTVTLELLEAHRERLRAVAGTEPVWIITDDPGAGWRPDRMTDVWERIRRRAGLPDTRLHDLRHYVGTVGVGFADAATVGARLTHADGGATTMRVYAHGTAEGQDTLTAALAGELAG